MVATDAQEGDKRSQKFHAIRVSGRSVRGAQILEVSLLGAATVLRLKRDAGTMVKVLRQTTNEYSAPVPLTPPF